MTAHTFKVGDRVRLVRDVERYPDFIARQGMAGTVCMVEIDGALAVKMDDAIKGCEDWGNEVHWFDDYRDDIAGDLAVEMAHAGRTGQGGPAHDR